MNSSRAHISNVHDHVPGQLTLNAKVPDQGLRVMKIGSHRWLRRGLTGRRRNCRQRIACIGETSITCSCTTSRNSDGIRWRRNSVAENVIEVGIVVDGEATANHCSIFTKQSPGKLRRVSEAHARCKIVLVTINFASRQQRNAEPTECRERRSILGHAIQLVTQA